MGLRLITGPPGSGKTHRIISEIQELNTKDPLGAPLILLVPEQATFQAERLVLSVAPHGTMRVQVLSFARLGRWIQARRPHSSRPVLTDVHRTVIVTGVLARMKQEAREGGLVSVPHLESSIAALLGEMKQGNIRTAELREWAQRLVTSNPALARKLKQIAEVASGFDEAVRDRFEDPQDTMLSLARSVREMKNLQGAQIYVDSFYGYTAVEREVLRGLLAGFQQVTVSLVLDRSLDNAMKQLELTDPATGRCAPSLETLQQLLRLAEREHQEKPEVIDLWHEGKNAARFKSLETGFLAQKYLAGFQRTNWMEPTDRLRLIKALDLREQARAAALQIEKWHRERGWRWGEMAIVARKVDAVAQEMGEALTALRIPHFLDRNQPEETHPIIQGSLTALDVVIHGWRQESILAFAKSGLFSFGDDEVAKLEWFCLKYPRHNSHWKQCDQWEEPPERSPFETGEGRRHSSPAMDQYDAIRKRVVEPLLNFEQLLVRARDGSDTLPVRAVVEAICHLVKKGMTDSSNNRQDSDQAQTDADQSILSQFGRLLDAIAMAAGEDRYEPAALIDLFSSILRKFRLQRIPPMIDQLVVAQADRSRLHEVKGVVIIGLAEGEFPSLGENRSLLSDEERENLVEFASSGDVEREVRASSRKMFRREAFFAWMAMARASEAVTLIRPTVSRQGDEMKESPWWIEVRRLFPKLEEETAADFPVVERSVRPREAAATISAQWGGLRDSHPPLGPVQLVRYAEGLTREADRHEYERVIRIAMRRNEACLSPVQVRTIFGDSWTTSATALEAFASCPFMFFMKNIMRPDIKQEAQINSMDLGNLAHAVLKNVFDRVRTVPLELPALDDGEVARLVEESMEKPLARLQRAGLLRDELGGIQAQLLEGQVRSLVQLFRDMAKVVGMRNLFTEESFSRHSDAMKPPIIRVPLPDGHSLEVALRGQIDRVDEWGNGWLLVLDYKLSARSIKWSEVADGKSLQLPIYLLVLEENRASLVDAGGRIGGAFYAAITSKGKDKRLRGAISANAAVELDLVDGMASFLTEGRGKNLEERCDGDLLADEAIANLVTGARHLITRHLHSIFNGMAEVRPARVGNTTPCQYCDHRMACRLDYAMNHQRLVVSRSKLEALQHISSLAGGGAQ